MNRYLSLLLLLPSLTVIAQPPNYVPTDGLIGWWPFNGNAEDQSGNGNDGVISGAILTADRFGSDNAAFSFAGQNSIDVGVLPNLNAAPQELTQSGWFKTSHTGFCKMPIMSKRQTQGGDDWPSVMFRYFEGDDTAAYFCYVVDDHLYSNGIDNPIGSLVGMNNDAWHHFTAIKSSSDYQLFVDGALVEEGNDSHVLDGSPYSMTFGYEGAFGFTCENYFTGVLDDIGIWDRSLTDTEIQQIYEAGVLSITKPRVLGGLSASPVPCEGSVHLHLPALGAADRLRLLDETGRTVMMVAVPVGTVDLDLTLEPLAPGHYMAQFVGAPDLHVRLMRE